MQYSDEQADKIISQYGLKKGRKYTWKWMNYIPDMYTDPSFKADMPLDERGLMRQALFLTVVLHPLIKHSGFNGSTDYRGKIDEMLTLRRGKETGRKRKDRVNLSTLNLSAHELDAVTKQARSLMDALLLATARRPYTDRQIYIASLFKTRQELTMSQALAGLHKKDRWKWINYYYDKRGPLELDEVFIIEHIQNKLIELLSLLETFMYYDLDR